MHFLYSADVREVRLQLDPDYSRESVSVNKKMRIFAPRIFQVI